MKIRNISLERKETKPKRRYFLSSKLKSRAVAPTCSTELSPTLPGLPTSPDIYLDTAARQNKNLGVR